MQFQSSVVNEGGAPSIREGVLADRPAPGRFGRLYVRTDVVPNLWYRDTGTVWVDIGASGGGGVSGSGTINKLPIWTAATALGDSTMAFDGVDQVINTGRFKSTGDLTAGGNLISNNNANIAVALQVGDDVQVGGDVGVVGKIDAAVSVSANGNGYLLPGKLKFFDGEFEMRVDPLGNNVIDSGTLGGQFTINISSATCANLDPASKNWAFGDNVIAAANASSVMELRSTTGKGFLIARATNAQRLALTGTPGLMVYQTDTVGLSLEGLYVYKTSGWTFII